MKIAEERPSFDSISSEEQAAVQHGTFNRLRSDHCLLALSRDKRQIGHDAKKS